MTHTSGSVHLPFTERTRIRPLRLLTVLIRSSPAARHRSPGTQSKGTELKLSTKTRALAVRGARQHPRALGVRRRERGRRRRRRRRRLPSSSAATLNGAGASSQEAAMQGWRAGFESTAVRRDRELRPGGLRRWPRAVHRRRRGLRRLRRRARRRGADRRRGALRRGRRLRAAQLHLADRGHLQPRGRRRAQPGPGDGRRHLRRRRSPPGTTRPSPRTTRTPTLPDPRSPRCTAGTTRARPPTSPSTCRPVAADVWTSEPDGEWPLDCGEAAQGTSGVVAAVTAGAGAIGYADLSQAGDLGVANIGVGEEFVAPSAGGRGRGRRGLGAGLRAGRVRLRHRGQPGDDRVRRVPDRAGQLPHRLRRVRRRRRPPTW